MLGEENPSAPLIIKYHPEIRMKSALTAYEVFVMYSKMPATGGKLNCDRYPLEALLSMEKQKSESGTRPPIDSEARGGGQPLLQNAVALR